ncbi:hypothetical protein ILFOPFJJ_06437 [Ensifer psoraleae]|nr:hypothetical protein [Sinorhizobium psoraleae]
MKYALLALLAALLLGSFASNQPTGYGPYIKSIPGSHHLWRAAPRETYKSTGRSIVPHQFTVRSVARFMRPT